MKKITALTAAIFFATCSLAAAGPHPHGPFPKHKAAGFIPKAHHNPHKPGPASSHENGKPHGPRS